MEKSDEIDMQSDVWNIAKGYTNLKILSHLVQIDTLITVATFGVENVVDSLLISPQIKTHNRIEALKRILVELYQIYENSWFVMNKINKNLLDKLKKRIDKVNDVIDGIFTKTIDQRIKLTKIKINEKHFNVCLEELKNIKREMNVPLNNSSLIFPTSDEIDFDKMKEELVKGG